MDARVGQKVDQNISASRTWAGSWAITRAPHLEDTRSPHSRVLPGLDAMHRLCLYFFHHILKKFLGFDVGSGLEDAVLIAQIYKEWTVVQAVYAKHMFYYDVNITNIAQGWGTPFLGLTERKKESIVGAKPYAQSSKSSYWWPY